MAMAASTMEVEQDLPGFRFDPTEEELLGFYLSRVALGKKLPFEASTSSARSTSTATTPGTSWTRGPGMANIGEREWYFFVPRDRKAGSGGRPNRTTERGFWKATGSDRAVRSIGDPKRVIGLKKTLVFYKGRAPRGARTDWVMNEYRLPDTGAAAGPPKEDMVLCKVYRKAMPQKELEQRAYAMEKMTIQRPGACNGVYSNDSTAGAFLVPAEAVSAGNDFLSSSDDVQDTFMFLSSSSSSPAPSGNSINDDVPREAKKESTSSLQQAANLPCNFQIPAANPPCTFQLPAANQPCSLQLPAASNGVFDLPSLQPLAASLGVIDWLQDSFLTQLRSPWQDQHCLSPYANLLYY